MPIDSVSHHICTLTCCECREFELYEPSMLDQEEEQVLPSVEDLAVDAQVELIEDTVLQTRSRTTRQG